MPLLAVLPFVVALACMGIGRYPIPFVTTVRALLSPLTGVQVAATDSAVLFSIRLPRLLLALSVGMGLSVAGLRSSPCFPISGHSRYVGGASGASFGAALGLILKANLLVVQGLALAMGILALAITYWISRKNGKVSIIAVVLSGMVISSLFQALVSFIKVIADPQDTLPSITYWLMGSMAGATYPGLALGLPFIFIGSLMIFLLRWRLNVIALSEDEAQALGSRLKVVRILIMGSATLVTASCVSMCGQVSWIGLLMPHVARLVCGSDNAKIVPVSMSFGAVFMVLVDTIARSVSASEIPLSILTAIIGAPLFVGLLRKMGGVR